MGRVKNINTRVKEGLITVITGVIGLTIISLILISKMIL